ncbi:MAG: Transposase, IS4 family [Clostridiales bacterium 38_11]|nr:MAG: Transposase, IS4 family [Clostridiales bacterium 38_11]
MYLDFLVKIPEVKGKITYRKRDNSCYVYYEYDRTYDPSQKYTNVKRAMIGKQSKVDLHMMQPNQNYLKFFPEVELPEEKDRTLRSSCLRVGAYIVFQKLFRESGIPEMLSQYFSEKDLGLFLDLATYSIITESNAAQYYPDYAYNHVLYTQDMRIYSDSKVSDFFRSITDNQSVGFLNSWNESKDHREKIYISYDSTNKNCQAGDIEMLEYGNAKVDQGSPIFNYSIAYDTRNKEPLFYEAYPGSINDVSQLQYMLDKAKGYGYKKIGFILDRGYFSKSNIEYMDQCGYSFVIMVRGMARLVNELILKHKGTFEKKRIHNISDYRVYGITVKNKLYATDEKDRYFHIYHSIEKESAERTQLENRIDEMTKFMKRHSNEMREFGAGFERYFELYYDEEHKTFLFPIEKAKVIENEIELCGYFCIITSEKMTAKEAIDLYKSRDASEKLFRGDKSYLGNRSLRVYSDESASAKIFIEFIALIIRSKIFTNLKEEMKSLDKRPNFMTVPAAIKELEKIEMVRQLDNVYRLDHAVTAAQKTILKAFRIDVSYVKYKADEISETLKK